MVISTSRCWDTNYIIVPHPNLCPRTGAKVRGGPDPTTGHQSLVAFPNNCTIIINILHFTVFTNNEEID